MPEVSFGKGAVPVTTVVTPVEKAAADAAKPATPAAATSTAVATVPSQPVSRNRVLSDDLPGFEDIILPRINLVHNTGQLKDTFIPGSIVLGRSTPLFIPPDIDTTTGTVKRAATKPVNITIIGVRPTRYVEKPEVYAPGVRNMIVDSLDEVRANGGTIDYKEWQLKKSSGMKRFEEMVDFGVLIERPDHIADDDTVFVYEVGGKKYTIAIWSLKGTAYTGVAKAVFFTQRTIGCLIKGYPTMSFSISTRNQVYKQTGNSTWVPVAVPASKNTPEVLAFVNQIKTGDVTPASAPEETAAE